MQGIAKIVRLGELRQGVSERTGNNWMRRQVVLDLYKQDANGQMVRTSESIVADCSDQMILQNAALQVEQMCQVRFFLDAREYQGRVYQNVTLNGFMPIQAQQPTMQQAVAPQPMAQQAVAPQPFAQPQQPGVAYGALGQALEPKGTDTFRAEPAQPQQPAGGVQQVLPMGNGGLPF